LVAVIRGEIEESAAPAIERHLAQCPSCSAERDSLVRTMKTVRAHVQPEVSADARLRLADALEEELAVRRRRGARVLLRPVFVLPAALAAGALVAFVVSGLPTSSPQVAATVAVRNIRSARATDSAGEFGGKAIDAASRGLAWLTASQRADGSWAASGEADAEKTAAATASALLAFAADGQSPHHGPRAAALRKARDRLVELVEGGLSQDFERKPVYALSLGVRALAAAYRLDHDVMPTDERRALREVLADAGKRIVDWQGVDGGFGYAPHSSRSDSSCTLFAAAAMKDLKDAGVADPGGAFERARTYLASLPAQDGGVAYMHPGDRRSAPALTAAWLALEAETHGSSGAAPKALGSVEEALGDGKDAFLAWTGFAALARHGRTLEAPVQRLLASQRPDGAWTAAGDRRCEAAGDAVTTAFGVMAMAQVYVR
jgi:hypothetical protein